MSARTGAFFLVFAALVGCDGKFNLKPAVFPPPPLPPPPAVAAGEKPKSFLDLPEPAVARTLDGRDVSKEPAARLESAGKKAADARQFADAAVYYYWAAQTKNSLYYDVACYATLAGSVDDGFYWLQKSGLTAGLDVDWANEDADLFLLRADRRWPSFLVWLRQCEAHHSANAKPVTTLIVPTGYDPKKSRPIPAVVWLHGMGSEPTGLVDPAEEDSLVQLWADELNVAFVGVSGTKAKAATRFVWAEDAKADMARVTKALAEVKDKVAVKPGSLIAFGFSQGAQTGLELAARHPDQFAGAIVLSPGSDRENLRLIENPSASLTSRGFVFGVGAGEHPGNRAQVDNGVQWLTKAGAKVDKQVFVGQKAHTFPADVRERFPQWVAFIRRANVSK